MRIFLKMCYMYNVNFECYCRYIWWTNFKKNPYIFQEMINLVFNGIYNNLPVAEDGIYMILPQFKYFSHTNSTSISSQSFSHGRGNISF